MYFGAQSCNRKRKTLRLTQIRNVFIKIFCQITTSACILARNLATGNGSNSGSLKSEICIKIFCQITTPSNYYDFVFIFRLQLLPPVSAAASGHFDAPPASPLWSFCGTPVPTPVWQCFQLGCRIRFLLPNTETPWQKAEVLALKDHEAMKIDSRNSYQYAPNGLVLVQVRNVINVH